MIEFWNVGLSYGDRDVLKDLSFAAHLYEKVAIIGASGEGKTTILRLLLGLTRPDSGTIRVDDVDITRLPESRLRNTRMKFTIVFQEGALFDSLSVRENVAFSLRERKDLTEPEIEEMVRELLRRVDMERAIDLMPEELSGGMHRRVAIARSLAACEPKMMLYDEPTTGLDPITAENIGRLINELSSGSAPGRTGLIVVTHDVTAAVRIAERFLYLRNGTIVFDGNLTELKNTSDAELKAFIKEIL